MSACPYYPALTCSYDSRKCSGKYRRIEVVYDIIGWKDHQTGDLLGSTETNGPQLPEASRPSCSVPQQRSAEDDEIHSYTRVQILDLKSPVDWLSHSESTSRECQMVVRLQDSEDISRFIRHLVRVYHLPEQYCRDAVEEYHGELFTSTRRISGTFDFPNISPEVSTARDVDITNFEIFDDFLSGVLSWPGDDLSMEDSKFGMCDAIHPKSILSSRTIAPAPSYARFLSGDYPFLPPNNFEQQLWESSISYFHWLTSSQTAPSDSNNATDTISLDHVATPPMTSDANVAVLPVSEITSFQTFRERHSEIQPPLDFERNCPILASEVGNKKRAPSLARPETNPRKRLFKPSSFQSSPSINTRRHFVDSLSVPVRPASYCPPQAMSAEDTGKCLKEPDWLF